MTQDQIKTIAAMNAQRRMDYYQQIERESGADYKRQVQ